MKKEVMATLRYFARFSYPPTLDELYMFLGKPASKTDLQAFMENMAKQKFISKIKARYTLGEYSIFHSIFHKRERISIYKTQRIIKIVKMIGFLPQVRLIGFSGSVAMSNAEERDDIDLFIITEPERMWTARLLSIGLSTFFGNRRKFGDKNAADKLCFNLFFDANNMKVPKKKQTEYGAHEILQMKPVIHKRDTYERFLQVNNWVFSVFPNAFVDLNLQKDAIQKKSIRQIEYKKWNARHFIGNIFERVAKGIQMYFINKHRTTEYITDTQLWFFPEDFEKKLAKKPHKNNKITG